MKLKIIVMLFTVLMLGGCTRAIVAKYETGVEIENNGLHGKELAVYQFEDARSWVDSKDEKSKGFIGKQGSWKFGLKYEDIPFQPVSLILQDVFIKEFGAVGVNAYKGEDSSTSSYSLKGKILNFEFENETGFWTVTSRRHVSLALNLYDEEGNSLLENELFNKVSRENEGIGVMHSTNVDKLMNEALKEVVINVINRTNTKLSYLGMETMSVSLNGIDLTTRVSPGSYAKLSID